MSRSKSATPVVNEAHPANALVYVDEEIKSQLLKTPVKLLIENETYEIQLKELRSDWKYAYVLQWLYYFRGAIKMIGDPFSVELIEEELVGLTDNTLINKISTNLASALIGSKVTPEDFSFKVRYLFGETADLLGTEDEPKDFDALPLLEKFDVLYNLIFQVQYTEIFRKQVEKYEREADLRFEPIFENNEETYFLLSDNRIYKRVINDFPKVSIPRKFKYAKNFNPEVELENLEPEFEWSLVAMGIYQIHDFLISIKSNKALKPLFQNIKDHINDLAQEDLNTRKKVVKRKREQQLHDLVSHRKRSSRLQEKDEQDRLRKLQQDEELERQKLEYDKLKNQRNLRKKVNVLKREIEERLKSSSTSRRGAIDLGDYIPSNLNEIELGEGEWLFECYCGIKEKNYDDGVKLITCERCNRWQHLKCQDRVVQQDLVRNSNDVFVCNWCKQDLELEVIKKLEDEKLELEREAEEKARHKEYLKQKAEERRLKLIEEERLRKEELERERQRRIQERERLKESSNSPLPSEVLPPPSSTDSTGYSPKYIPIIKPLVSAGSGHNGPVMGTFQTTYRQPIHQEVLNQTNTTTEPEEQAQPPVAQPVALPAEQPAEQPTPVQDAQQLPTLQSFQHSPANAPQVQAPQVQEPQTAVPHPHQQASPLKNLLQSVPEPSGAPLQAPLLENTNGNVHESSPSTSFSIQNILQ